VRIDVHHAFHGHSLGGRLLEVDHISGAFSVGLRDRLRDNDSESRWTSTNVDGPSMQVSRTGRRTRPLDRTSWSREAA
jgi:hypothetical protein